MAESKTSFEPARWQAIILGTVALTVGVGLHAQSIAVPNGSFELQSAEGFPFSTNPSVDSWQKIAEPAYYASLGSGTPPWFGTAGVFVNAAGSAPYGNVIGTQVGYILMAPQVTLFQDFSNTPAFDATFEIGKSYNLTIGLFARSSFGSIPEGSTLELSLYYRDGLDNIVTVSSTAVSYSAAAFPAGPNPNLIDYQVNVPPVLAGDAWAGQHIGIQLESTIPIELTSFGNWDFDNVRLNAVPEPSSLALVGLALGGLLLRRSRRQS